MKITKEDEYFLNWPAPVEEPEAVEPEPEVVLVIAPKRPKITKAEKDYIFWQTLMAGSLSRKDKRRSQSKPMKRNFTLSEKEQRVLRMK